MFPTEAFDEASRRLAEIQGELWDLDDDDFEARYALQLERDRLRAEVRSSFDPDSDRTTEDLTAELEAKRASLIQIQESLIDLAGMSGGGGDGTGSYEGPGDGLRLNSDILTASGAVALSDRITRLETLLFDRQAVNQ